MGGVVTCSLGMLLCGFGVASAVRFCGGQVAGRCMLQMFTRLLVVLLQCRVVDGFGGFGRVQGHSVLSWLNGDSKSTGFGLPARPSCVQANSWSVRHCTV